MAISGYHITAIRRHFIGAVPDFKRAWRRTPEPDAFSGEADSIPFPITEMLLVEYSQQGVEIHLHCIYTGSLEENEQEVSDDDLTQDIAHYNRQFWAMSIGEGRHCKIGEGRLFDYCFRLTKTIALFLQHPVKNWKDLENEGNTILLKEELDAFCNQISVLLVSPELKEDSF